MGKRFTLMLAVAAFFLLLEAGAFALLASSGNSAKTEVVKIVEDSTAAKEQTACVARSEQFTVQGGSMSPFIKSGETVEGLFGYYDCHEIQKGDIVLLRYAGNKNPLIKFVRGIPGDTFAFKSNGSVYNLFINGAVVKNSAGTLYNFSGQGYRMLSLYMQSYRNEIPADAYLVLGDDTNGSLDSERFGLIGKSDILAKAVLVQ